MMGRERTNEAAMLVIERFTRAQLYFQHDLYFATPQRCNNDSS